MSKTIISLCDYSGAWSRPYREAGYEVIQIDPKLPGGATAQQYLSILKKLIAEGYTPGPIQGILMAPPCTDFAGSGAQYWKAKDADGRTAASLEIIDACLEIRDMLRPVWWALENPVGRLPQLRPELGKPWYWQPWWYGDAYTKKTGLWGNFNRELPRNEVEPIKVCEQGSWIQKLGGKSEKTKELRSMTPEGFARAFFEANP